MPRPLLTQISAALAWLSATLVALAPLLIAADSGGVLPWTQWAAAIACLAVLALAAPEGVLSHRRGGWQRNAVAILLLAVAGYGLLQSAPLPHGLVQTLAPGSADAYSGWLRPLALLPADGELLQATATRLSVDAALTRSAAWLSVLVAGFAYAAGQLFTVRPRIQLLLLVFALTAAVHAGLGIYQVLAASDATVWGIRSYHGGTPFGAFVNRSNAAVMLNLGLAGSLGLVAWRLAALTGAPLNGERFPVSELLDIAMDRLAMLALATASLTIIGLLSCGSRSGMVGLVGGLLLALGMVQSVHKLRGLLATAIGIGMIVAIMMFNFDLSALSANRWGATAEAVLEKSQLHDARFAHWRDGFAAGLQQPITGWGWGAYRYAYLPFQETGSAAWFVNADNLWLELFVETGLVGMGLLIAAIVIITRALSHLGRSADPIDHGLVIAGWFALGAMATSQFFDFGLRIPANSIMAAVLFSAILARSYSAGSQSSLTTAHHRFRIGQLAASPVHDHGSLVVARCVSLVLFAMFLCFVSAAAHAFSWNARGDKAMRAARLLPRDEPLALATAQPIADALADYVEARPLDSAAWRELSRLELDLGRLHAAEKIHQSMPDLSVDEALQSLSRAVWRRQWYSERSSGSEQDSAAMPSESRLMNEHPELGRAVHAARQHTIAALLACPLSPEARLATLALDFSGGNPAQSSALLQQAATLRKQSPVTLFAVGELAAEANDWDFAASSWKRSLHLKPIHTAAVLRRIAPLTALRPNDVVADTPASLRAAAVIEVQKPSPDAALLSRAIPAIKRSLSVDQAGRAEQLQLLVKIQLKLNRFEDASRTLQQAIAAHPRDAEVRLQYATTLALAGKLDEAKTAARTGQQIAPEDPRFDNLIQDIDQRTNTPADH